MQGKRKVILAILAVLLIVSAPYIIRNALWLLEIPSAIIQGRWDFVAINVAVFLFFLVLIGYKKKVSWTARGIYSAFIIALFAEMYGFPLTTYFLSSYVGGKPVIAPKLVVEFSLLGASFAMTWVMLAGFLVTIAGMTLVVLGWREIYRGRGKLVTTGIYRHTRNPQYLGFFLITGGWLLAWPTLINIFMWPVLVVIYCRLAKKEEKEVEKRFGKKFIDYKAKVPAWV